MRISFSATNPCHVWDMARALAADGQLGTYYSGYPQWRLRGSDGVAVRAFPARTLAVYSARKFLPESLRPKDRKLFRWQDWAFDRAVAKHLDGSDDFLHGLPGQALATFRRAKQLGLTTVLSHATGPVRDLEATVRPEYERVGLTFSDETQYDDAYYEREAEEYALADFHWAASSIVAERLIGAGVESNRIWTVPYGVDPDVFRRNEIAPPEEAAGLRLAFAGQLGVRKGIRFLLDGLATLDDPKVSVDFFGHRMAEAEPALADYGKGPSELRFHGAVPQPELSQAFARADALVLPSLEEGFGLVVAQALACGLPCLVSDAVGAKDLITPGANGLIFEAANATALAHALSEARNITWDRESIASSAPRWETAAKQLVALSAKAHQRG